MIYGLNFNGKPIPAHLSKRFAHRLNEQLRGVGANRSCTWTLQGVCESAAEVDAMAAQANNGHRRFHCSTKTIDGKSYVGFYIGYK